jgi:hypothetical protein
MYSYCFKRVPALAFKNTHTKMKPKIKDKVLPRAVQINTGKSDSRLFLGIPRCNAIKLVRLCTENCAGIILNAGNRPKSVYFRLGLSF